VPSNALESVGIEIQAASAPVRTRTEVLTLNRPELPVP
jgi:hypothetical protein